MPSAVDGILSECLGGRGFGSERVPLFAGAGLDFWHHRKEQGAADGRFSRITATNYLNQLTKAGILRKEKRGKSNFYINEPLFTLLSGVTLEDS